MAKPVKICKFCSEENLLWAHYCRGCQGPLEDAPVESQAYSFQFPRSLMVGILLCAMAFAVFWTLFPMTSVSTGPTGTAIAPGKNLKVLWHKFYTDLGKDVIVGEVANLSKRPLDQVLVVGDFYDSSDRQLGSTSAPLEKLPLAPGATSHFTVGVPHQNEIEKSWFHFQTADGQQLSYDR